MTDAAQFAVLQAQVAALDRRIDDKFEALKTATDTAFESNDQRLHAMNEFRSTLSDQAARLITRVEALTQITMTRDQTRAEIDTLRAHVEQATKPNWGALFAMGTMALTMGAGFWTVITLRVDASTAPVAAALQQMTQAQAVQDTRIETLGRSVREIRDAQSTANVAVTRLNVWADFLHARDFPNMPGPPQKQP